MKIIAYETAPSSGYDMIPAPHNREWMDHTLERGAYRCLPMLLACQAGWWVLNPIPVRMKWDGFEGIEIQHWTSPSHQTIPCPGPPDCTLEENHLHKDGGPDYLYPSNHFGSGIVTWRLPWLFRTPPGWNMLARGPANFPKDGISPLEGLVECDWSIATFTMNWKITRPEEWIVFHQGDPICQLVPQRRGELEEFDPQILPISTEPELEAAHRDWGLRRDHFNAEKKIVGTEAEQAGWQRHYFRGNTPSGGMAPEHQTRLHLKPFTPVTL